MSDFNDMMQAMVNLETEEKIAIALKEYAYLYPTLKAVDPKNDGMMVALEIFAGSMAADGKLTQNELGLIRCILGEIHDMKVTEDEVINVYKAADGDTYRTVKALADAVDVDDFKHLIALISAICAIDDTITADEAGFIASLFS